MLNPKRLHHGFLLNVKLEVVDKRNPSSVSAVLHKTPHTCAVRPLAKVLFILMAGTTNTTAGWMQAALTFTPLHGVMSQVIPWKFHVDALLCEIAQPPITERLLGNLSLLLQLETRNHSAAPGVPGLGGAFGWPCSDRNLKKGGNASGSSERTNTGKKVESGSAHSISKNLYSLNFSGRLQKVNNQPVQGRENGVIHSNSRELNAGQWTQVCSLFPESPEVVVPAGLTAAAGTQVFPRDPELHPTPDATPPGDPGSQTWTRAHGDEGGGFQEGSGLCVLRIQAAREPQPQELDFSVSMVMPKYERDLIKQPWLLLLEDLMADPAPATQKPPGPAGPGPSPPQL
ncbi:hypothetical protein R6Z07M_018248 [Ovis aries]